VIREPAPVTIPATASPTPPTSSARPSRGPSNPLFIHAIKNVNVAGIAASRKSSTQPVTREPTPAAAAATPSVRLRAAARFKSDGPLGQARLRKVADNFLAHSAAALRRFQFDLPPLVREVNDDFGRHRLVLGPNLNLVSFPSLLK
jgi:hypothetical protein